VIEAEVPLHQYEHAPPGSPCVGLPASLRACLTEWDSSDVAKNAARNPYAPLRGNREIRLRAELSTEPRFSVTDWCLEESDGREADCVSDDASNCRSACLSGDAETECPSRAVGLSRYRWVQPLLPRPKPQRPIVPPGPRKAGLLARAWRAQSLRRCRASSSRSARSRARPRWRLFSISASRPITAHGTSP